jgi:hypothetical protein
MVILDSCRTNMCSRLNLSWFSTWLQLSLEDTFAQPIQSQTAQSQDISRHLKTADLEGSLAQGMSQLIAGEASSCLATISAPKTVLNCVELHP